MKLAKPERIGALQHTSGVSGRRIGGDVDGTNCPRVAGYEPINFIGWLCGRGGGPVQLARKTDTGTVVLLRVFHDDEKNRRIAETGVAQSRWRHPNVLCILDVGAAEGRLYIASEYEPDLRTLDQRLKSGPLSVALALSTAQAIASVLEGARHHGFSRAEFSGASIQFSVADALRMPAEHFMPPSALEGMVPENPLFLPPEAMTNWDLIATPAADVYRVGVAAYAMLTGRYPFREQTAVATIQAAMRSPVPPLRDFVPDLPDEVAKLCSRCLSKRPEDRYSSVGELRRAIASIVV